ncbi:hypothetical protein [uncultured Helicobacter sp.]|uniref:hypothetical protein n=1 Tax=uncultured Helicobacter sp. TaxID=175537 RepID=UPI00374F2593
MDSDRESLEPRNSACTQSLLDLFGSTSVTTAKVAPLSYLQKQANLTHNPRISGKALFRFYKVADSETSF